MSAPAGHALVLPNFLLVGAMKAGTTSVYRYLGRHPEVWTCPWKEPHFFTNAGRSKDEIEWDAVTSLEEYAALFEPGAGARAIGEGSTLYLSAPAAPGRIREVLGAPRILIMLRDPVERAWSHFRFQVQEGREPLLDFEAALDAEEERGWGPPWNYRRLGLYHDQVERYLDAFGPDRVEVQLFDDLKDDPAGVVRAFWAFLDVDPDVEPEVERRHNVTRGYPRSGPLHRWLHADGSVRRLARRLPGRRWGRRALETVASWNTGREPEMRPETRERLRKGYAEDVRRLEGLIGRDLSAWLS